MHVLVSWPKLRSVGFERLVDGTPITIVDDGERVPAEMSRLRIRGADVRTAMRQQGMTDEKDLRDVVAERDGTISIIPAD